MRKKTQEMEKKLRAMTWNDDAWFRNEDDLFLGREAMGMIRPLLLIWSCIFWLPSRAETCAPCFKDEAELLLLLVVAKAWAGVETWVSFVEIMGKYWDTKSIISMKDEENA